jgi:hypothetical protein
VSRSLRDVYKASTPMLTAHSSGPGTGHEVLIGEEKSTLLGCRKRTWLARNI